VKFDLGHVAVHKRNRLPHWNVEHGIYFVTFNLFDAIPMHVRKQLKAEAASRLQRMTPIENQTLRLRIEEALDADRGSCFMRDPRVAEIVANAMEYGDTTRYELLAWCVMPNHVHVLLTLAGGERIERIVQRWKSFTSKAANKLLDRSGSFWHENYFDRSIRDSRELHHTIEYVVNNPAKAGLLNWPFVRCYLDRIPF
jgi:REP element-mobilizing transposase RayT